MSKAKPILENLKSKEVILYCGEPGYSKNKMKNRTVFDEDEIDFLYAEFSFYNKQFDENEWSANFSFKLIRIIDNGQEVDIIFEKDAYKTVTPTENLVTISDYPSDSGQCWMQGEFAYQVWFENKLLAEKIFYIESAGKVTGENNPYFDFLSLKLFEGAHPLPIVDDRKYLTRFRDDATRYIWIEFEILNKFRNIDWKGEFFFNLYNSAKELVETISVIEDVFTNSRNNNFTVFAKRGNNTEVTWEKDNYTLEIVFMDTFIASASFEVASSEHKGELVVCAPSKDLKPVKTNKPIEAIDLIFDELDQLIGLKEIKEKLREYYFYAKYVLLRREKGIEPKDELNLNFVFTGNPGTGKTTVARMLGKIFKSLGLLTKDTVFEVDRSDLIGRYIGETAPQTKEVIEKARGGMLFIDEAYSLHRNDEKDFGHEAIEALVKELSDGPGNISIVVAGYPKEMKAFLESNPGLKSRFNNWYDFDDYIPNELIEIARSVAKKKTLIISKEAEDILFKIITDEFRKRERSFGNARFVNSLIEEAQVNLGLRIMKHEDPSELSLEYISTISKEDVEKIIHAKQPKYLEFPIDEQLLKKSLLELNSLVGLSKVKSEITEVVKLVRFYKENKKDILNSLSLNNVFIGSPGTGKTTVARILANIYKALGLLEKGHLVECARDSLVAGYMGQTAIKTKNMIDEAMGGVLFIDEAYSLTNGNGNNDFGHESIEIILKAMEDYRGKFSLVTAGYTEEMIEFINSNPGLKSRFDNYIKFEDYEPADMLLIADKLLAENKINIETKAKEHLYAYFEFHYSNKDKYFGNARFVRKIIEEALKNIYVRISDIPIQKRNDEMTKLLTFKDVEEFVPSKDDLFVKKRNIGF